MVARRLDKLKKLQEELREWAKVEIHVINVDLSKESERLRLQQKICGEMKLNIDVLVNNAGSTTYGLNSQVCWEDQKTQIDLNVMALVHLTKIFLPSMLSRGFGYIIQVASITAYAASPYYGVYCATKSFVLSYTESLHEELKGTGVKALCVCPGPINTDFFAHSGQQSLKIHKDSMVEPDFVSRATVDKMFESKSGSFIPDWYNTLAIFLVTTFLPRSFLTWMAGQLSKPEETHTKNDAKN